MTLMVTLDPSLVQRHSKGSTSGTDIVSPKEGRFIYCLTECGEELYPFTGLEGAKLETISYGDIAAVVSPLRTIQFDQSDREAIRESILKHQEVINRIFTTHTVVPVRFGTIADDPTQVKELLKKVYLQIRAALKKLPGKIELVVHASWDLSAVLQEVKREFTRGLAQTIDLQEKIAIGRRVFEVIEARKKVIVEAIHKGLHPLALDFSVRKPEGEEMIFDCSYLIEREKETLFDEALNRLANEYEGRLTFKYIGPLPPYSFTRLEISQGNFEVVEEARKTLGLPEKASLEEIKACYRRLSLAHHPDRNPGDPRAVERFRHVAQSYEILEAYSEDNRWLGEGGIYSFTRDDVESAVMVSGRRLSEVRDGSPRGDGQ